VRSGAGNSLEQGRLPADDDVLTACVPTVYVPTERTPTE
jgi:hypothetical protein